MKKVKKVYGVYNIVEWYAQLKVGRAFMNVRFSGGAMTTQGVTPATFTTMDPVVQLAIENSDAYKRGKIKLIKKYPTNEDVVVARNERKNALVLNNSVEQTPAKAPDITVDSGAADEPDASATDNTTSEVTDNAESTDSTAPQAPAIVKVTCVRDAAEYLRAEYGIATSKLRNKEAITAAAEQYGITFEYVKPNPIVEDSND